MRKVGIISGGFDPIHSGHINYILDAASKCDYLYIGPNSDQWLRNKKGKEFMCWDERANIIRNLNLNCAFEVIAFEDDELGSATNLIKLVNKIEVNSQIVFMNGGDRNKTNIPEERIQLGKSSWGGNVLSFEFGIGGEHKQNSSSLILQEWKEPKTQRDWGYYRVLHENGPEVKVKELTVDPGKRLSMQRHEKRAEHWFVSEGVASVYGLDVTTDITKVTYERHQSLHIKKGEWHMLANETDKPLKVVEIQYGEECVEEDIERRNTR